MVNYVVACKLCRWNLEIWPIEKPEESLQVPFLCHSWRHAGECRLWKGAQDFVRIKEAMEGRDHWCHCVITHYQPEGVSYYALYREGVLRWAKLRKRLTRQFGEIKYIQLWERHRSGAPHIHLALSNENIFRGCWFGPRRNWEFWLVDSAVECGFGERGWLEPIRDRAAMAGYFSKLATEMVGGSKEYQIPENAPAHFRRLRASVRLLPPVKKNHDYTGVLWQEDVWGELRRVGEASADRTNKTESLGKDAQAVAIMASSAFDPEMVLW